MATFLHRTTKQLVPDDGTGNLGPDYIRNPDLSAVIGIPASRWVIDGDNVVPPSEAEQAVFDAADLVAAKTAKITAIDARTAEILVAGLTVAPGKVISTSLQATQNLQDIALGRSMGLLDFPQDISTRDGGSYTITDLGDFARVAALLRDFKTNALLAGRLLRADVLNAETIAVILEIVDTR